MKLLSPTEIKSNNQTEINRNLIRIQAVREELDEVQNKLNNAEAKFDATLARQRVTWEEEKAKHLTEIQALESEVEALKKQREPLLIPIELDRKKAHDLLVEADKALSEANARKEDVDELKETLEGKLDDISDREEDLAQKEAKFALKSANLDSQSANVDKLSTALTEKWEQFFVEKELWNKQKADERNALNLLDINLKAREQAVLERREEQYHRERAINDKLRMFSRKVKKQNQTP